MSEGVPAIENSQKPVPERKKKKFIEAHKRLVRSALVMSTVAAFSAPLMCRLALTAIEVGVPYLQYHDDPVNRGKVTQSAVDAMKYWPDAAQKILIPLLDRIDENKETGTDFIIPLITSSYGRDIDPTPIIDEWKLLDEAESLKKSLGVQYPTHLDVIAHESQLYEKLADTSTPFQTRLALLPSVEGMKTMFPDMEALASDLDIRELVFVRVHLEKYPSLTVEQLRSIFNTYSYMTSTPYAVLPYVGDAVRAIDDHEFSTPEIKFYWEKFDQYYTDKLQLFLDVNSNFLYDDIAVKLQDIQTLGITDPALIWKFSQKGESVLQWIEDGLGEASQFYKSAYDLSSSDLEAAVTKIQRFQSTGTDLQSKLVSATQFLNELNTTLRGNKGTESKPLFPGASDVNTPIIAETPQDDRNILYQAHQLAPDVSDAMYWSIQSLLAGHSSTGYFGSTSTDQHWSMDEITQFYSGLFRIYPHLSKQTVLNAANYVVWGEIRNGERDKNAIKEKTNVSLMATEDTLVEIERVNNPRIASALIVSALEPIISEHLMLNPIELASKMDNVVAVNGAHFSGAMMQIDSRSLQLTANAFHRDDKLEPNQLAIVLPWSYFLSDTHSAESNIINPAVRMSDGNEKNIGTAISGEKLQMKMIGFTSDGKVIEQLWSTFGSTQEEILTQLQKEGITSAFTPNFLYDSTLPDGQQITDLGALDDHQTTFMAVSQSSDGDQHLYVYVLKPKPAFDEIQLIEKMRENIPAGDTLVSVVVGDPGYGVYAKGEKVDSQNMVLAGLNERETNRLLVTPLKQS